MGHYKAADFNGAWHDVLVGSTSDHSPERRHILDKQLAAFLLNASGMTLSPGEFQRLKSFLNDGRYNMYSYDSAKANRIGTSDLSAINKLTLRSDVTTDVYMTSNEATHIHNIADVLKMPMLKDAFMDSRKYASFVAAFCGALTNVKDEKSTRKMTGGYVLDFRAFNGVLSKEERHEGLRKVGAYLMQKGGHSSSSSSFKSGSPLKDMGPRSSPASTHPHHFHHGLTPHTSHTSSPLHEGLRPTYGSGVPTTSYTPYPPSMFGENSCFGSPYDFSSIPRAYAPSFSDECPSSLTSYGASVSSTPSDSGSRVASTWDYFRTNVWAAGSGSRAEMSRAYKQWQKS